MDAQRNICPEGKRRAMDESRIELINGIFAELTALLEDAHEIAIKGQSRRLTPLQILENSNLIGTAAKDISKLAKTIAIITKADINHPRDSG